MKTKIIIPILILFFAFGVLAQTGNLPNSGLTPDSPVYFLKAWKESIQTFFTFGAENKAKQYLYLAEVRLNEYQKMLEKGKTEIAEKTLTKYQNQLNRALEKAEELKDKGKDVKELTTQIQEATSKHLEILNQNLEKAPEQARKGIKNAIENLSKNLEKVLEKKIQKKTCKDLCGDGVCQEGEFFSTCEKIVSMPTNCPCTETKESCPQDCEK